MPSQHEPRLTVLGVNHAVAGPDVRAALQLDAAEVSQSIELIRQEEPTTEAMVVSTCNRTELIVSAPPTVEAHDLWHRAFHGIGRVDAACLDVNVHRMVKLDAQAAEHLFRLSCGLESSILGDMEIMSQLRSAATIAQESGGMGRVLHKLHRMAMEIGKQARHHTDISFGGAGVGSAAASAVAAWEERHGSARVLVVGAGQAATSIVHRLREKTSARIVVVNRTYERGADLAARVGGEASHWRWLGTEMVESDIVITAVEHRWPVISAALVEASCRVRGEPVLILDAGMPPNVEPNEAAEVVRLDDLGRMQTSDMDVRARSVPDVERMVSAMTLAWTRWVAGMDVDREIASMYLHAERGQLPELAMHLRRTAEELSGMSRLELRRVMHAEASRRRQAVDIH